MTTPLSLSLTLPLSLPLPYPYPSPTLPSVSPEETLRRISPVSPLHLPCISLYLPCISLQVSAEETLRLIATFAYPVGQVHEI